MLSFTPGDRVHKFNLGLPNAHERKNMPSFPIYADSQTSVVRPFTKYYNKIKGQNPKFFVVAICDWDLSTTATPDSLHGEGTAIGP